VHPGRHNDGAPAAKGPRRRRRGGGNHGAAPQGGRHVCRLEGYPDPLRRSLDDWNMDVYGVMQGPNEFLYTGNLKDWNRIPEMHEITVPTLIVCGQHDEITPACSMRMLNALPNAEIAVFPNSSHMAMYEEPEAYFARLTKFLGKQRGKKK
jgi:proline iminopeptidase